ncbi:YeeE/YedE family protein [Sphaerotilus sp.]|uniref:YeeE/YedE family protein n=1 Tax=Sphaerotilus sp. TaxID=2093942 RepID=UPI0025F2688C|nr:YeeE/YedE thiosulfate transporter family protein [Sphaerotilus sp.]
MNIDWIHFTPGSALTGGALIGVASALYLLGSGRIAGIAGIVAEPLSAWLLRKPLGVHAVRLLFVLGLLLSPWIWRLWAPLPPMVSNSSAGTTVLAGLLVGFGTRMGNGCTSGHGVCGLSRLSGRSLVNVLAFMGAGFATVLLTRHLLA